MSLGLGLAKLPVLVLVLGTPWADGWPPSACLTTEAWLPDSCPEAATPPGASASRRLRTEPGLLGLIRLSPSCGTQATRLFLSLPRLTHGRQESCEGKERAQPVDRVRTRAQPT